MRRAVDNATGVVVRITSTEVARLIRPGNVGIATSSTGRTFQVGLDDKIENKADDLKGKAKEATGKATDDSDMEAEGKTDQTKSSLKDAKENVKDAFS
jgi:uncharacterized protein YjbJ (UPF0337 family)